MDNLASNILSLSAEAAVLVEKGRIAFVNPAAAALLGTDCVGKSVKDALSPELAETQAASFIGDVPIQGRHCIVRVNKLDNCQLIFITEANPSALSINNEALFFSANNTLNNMNLAIDSGMLRGEALGDSVVSACFSSLSRSCYSLRRVLSNASIVSSFAHGKLNHDRKMTDLSLLYGSLIDTISAFYPAGLFSLNLGQGICAPVDCHLAMQLLYNLLSNCIRHGAGSRISLSLTDTGDNVVLSVSDNGKGIAPDDLHRVFDRYRHGFEAVELGRGAGLGMAVVRAVAEVHGGTLLMESRQGQGTSVRVSFSKKCDKAQLWAEDEIYCGQMRSILVGMADCLPAECFSEKYSD